MIEAVILTLELACVTTVVLLCLAAPLAWWLAGPRSLWRDVVTAVTALPVVLPPTVLGFYVLIALGPHSPLMWVLAPFGVRTLNFSFAGLVIGSLIYSLPFAVQPLRNAFLSLGPRQLEAAATLGAAPLDRFISIALPQARNGFLAAGLLVFAHTIGEFGVVLMIGGAIPGQTEVVSIRIWQMVEQMNWAGAHALSGGLLVFSLIVLIALLRLNAIAGGKRD